MKLSGFPIFTCIFLIFVTAGVVGDIEVQRSPVLFYPAVIEVLENVEIRKDYTEIILGSNTDILQASEAVWDQSYEDHRVRFQTRKTEEYLYLLFTNEIDFKFPLYSSGSYIIKKERETGDFIQVKIFIRGDQDSFIRVFPWAERSKMDVYIRGYRAYKDVNLPQPFEQLVTAPFSLLMETTADSVDWSLFTAGEYGSGSRKVQTMVRALREALPGLDDENDGAMDADGIFRYIENLAVQETGGLNCSGFAKWVVDGIYFGTHSTFLDIESLKQKPIGLRGNRWSNRHEDERDPYFGLDWTRNLASAVQRTGSLERWDVRDIPFLTYVEDVGFPVEHLDFILYYLALKDPGYFYLASINKPFGEEPTLRQHFHVALLFPYFDEEGSFQPVIMETTEESTMKGFLSRYGRDFMHLVRIKAPETYSPPSVQ